VAALGASWGAIVATAAGFIRAKPTAA
jgi:hypothetical protein